MSGDLWCMTCHTKWTESCLDAQQPCPFKDCEGRLMATPPPNSLTPRPKKAQPTYPLFELLERAE